MRPFQREVKSSAIEQKEENSHVEEKSNGAGPSVFVLWRTEGAGKSTVAQALMKWTTRPTVLVDLDHYRFSFVNPPNRDHDLEYEMSGSDVLIGLKLGFDVIFDGNFTA